MNRLKNVGQRPRRDERIAVNAEFASLEEYVGSYATNVSRSGAFLKGTRGLELGARVPLHFTLILDAIETIEGVGEVVRVEEEGVAVRFVELTQESERVLDTLSLRPNVTGYPSRRTISQTVPSQG